MKFEDLDVWKRSARMSAEIYMAMADLKDYGFKDQICRSGLSVPSNIAEGMDGYLKRSFYNSFDTPKVLVPNFEPKSILGKKLATSRNQWHRHGFRSRKKSHQ